MNPPGPQELIDASWELVCLARHAQPEGDGVHRFTGQADPPLGCTGLEQARLLALKLHEYGFEAVHSSDLRRSAQTAGVLAEEMGVPLHQDFRLREIDTGRWEGLTPAEVRRLYPAQYAEREADILGYPFPEGESFRQLAERVARAFKDIQALGGSRVLIVAHLGVNRALFCRLTGRPFDRLFELKQDYCAYELVWLPMTPEVPSPSARPHSSAPPSGSGGR